ncbi:lipopolysaccharide biosynthesis protein [Lentilitoribacter sp. EG35]
MSDVILSVLQRLMPNRLSRLALPKLAQIFAILENTDGTRNAERTALLAFAIRILSAAVAFLSQIILARSMGGFEYGIFVFIWVFVIIAGNLSCLGLHTTVIKFLPQYETTGQNSHIRGLTFISRVFAIIIASIFALIGVGAVFFFENSIPDYYLVPIILGGCAIPMIALGDVLDGTSRANNWPIVALSPTFIIRPGLIILFVLGAILIGYEANARLALLCALASTYITTFAQFITVTYKLGNRFQKGHYEWEIKQWVGVSIPIFFIEGFYYLLTNADVIIVGFFLSPERVAIYFAAAKTMALVHFIYFAVKAGAAPRFSALYASGDMGALNKFVKQTARWTFFPTIAMGAFVIVFGQFILSMFGESFIEGYTVMAILLIGILAKACIGPGEVLLFMAGHQKICTIIYAVTLSANLSLNFALIPLFGIMGAAMATAGAMFIEAILLFIVIYKKMDIMMFVFSPATKQNVPNYTVQTNRKSTS